MKKLLIGLTLLTSMSAISSETFRQPKANIDGNSIKITCQSDMDKVCSFLGKSVGEEYTASVGNECSELSTSVAEDATGTIYLVGRGLVDIAVRATTGNGLVGQSVQEPWKQKKLVTISNSSSINEYYSGQDKIKFITKIECE